MRPLQALSPFPVPFLPLIKHLRSVAETPVSIARGIGRSIREGREVRAMSGGYMPAWPVPAKTPFAAGPYPWLFDKRSDRVGDSGAPDRGGIGIGTL